MTDADAELVAELQRGNKAAFAEIYRRHKYQIYRFCLRMLGDSDSAQDVVQGVFIKIYEHSGQIRNPERLRSWLHTGARNDCLRFLRKKSNSEATLEQMEQEAPERHTASEPALTSNTSRAIAEAVGKLPTELREVIILREYDDFSYQEIADITGVKIGLVKFRLFAARKKLAESLSRVLKGTAKYEL